MEKLIDAVAKLLSEALGRIRYRSRIGIAEDALKQEVLKGGSRGLVEEELKFMLVRQVTTLAANDATREKVFELIQKSKGELSIGHFTQSGRRLQMQGGKLVAVVEPTDGRNHKIAMGICAVILLAGAAVTLIPTLLHAAGFAFGAGIFGAAILQGVPLMILSIFLITQVEHIRAAAELAPILERLQADS